MRSTRALAGGVVHVHTVYASVGGGTTRRQSAEARRSQQEAARQLHWGVEHDDRSVAELKRGDESSGATLTLHYALGPGRPFNQFAALVAAIRDGVSRYDRVTFTGRASHPLRVGVQLRPIGRDNPPRWQRSVYLDESPRAVTVRFDDLRPIPRDVTGPPPLASIGALMFVVDTNNTAPGTSGDIVFTDIAFGLVGS